MPEKINIRKIAELAGCSASTVSRVLSGKTNKIPISVETRARILEICREHDYAPSIHAARFFSRQSRVIGFVIPQGISLVDDNLARSMDAFYTGLWANSYRVVPFVCDEEFIEKKVYLDLFQRKEVDAAVIWGVGGDNSWLDELAEKKFPFVLLTNRSREYPSVSCDNAAGIAALVGHCRGKGAEKFACIAINGGECSKEREIGFLEATVGLQSEVFTAGWFDIDSGRKLVDKIISYNPDAVICLNDRVAIGLENALLERSLSVPDDIMITGADNIELSCYCPVPLTTFDQMATECAQKCAGMLVDFLAGNGELSSIIVEPEIIIRSSV